MLSLSSSFHSFVLGVGKEFVEIHVTVLLSAMSIHPNLGPYIRAASDIMSGLPEVVSSPEQRTPLIVDAEFVNHILNRYTWQQIALRDIGPLHEALEEILGILETEVGS